MGCFTLKVLQTAKNAPNQSHAASHIPNNSGQKCYAHHNTYTKKGSYQKKNVSYFLTGIIKKRLVCPFNKDEELFCR